MVWHTIKIYLSIYLSTISSLKVTGPVSQVIHFNSRQPHKIHDSHFKEFSLESNATFHPFPSSFYKLSGRLFWNVSQLPFYHPLDSHHTFTIGPLNNLLKLGKIKKSPRARSVEYEGSSSMAIFLSHRNCRMLRKSRPTTFRTCPNFRR